ncbi:MAG: polysaccharide deacetylase family protein, partial [Bacteroidia bacterium]|nr:polysaccharide deacetylase family protein [Bacteroidia bacterium]
MFALKDIDSVNLNDKTLCLTYDDGPGQFSEEIGRFLFEQGVRATFFVVGKFAVEHPDILEKLHQWGHIIGNHTFEHPDMPIYVGNNGDIRDQIIRTNVLIEKYNRNGLIYFRAPYGKWSPEVANALNTSLRSSHKMCGPVYWQIPGIDCYFWKLGKSVDETVDAYVNEIETHGKGIIVMHDEIADMDSVKPLNKTLELTKALIPLLKNKGYNFIGLDEIAHPALKDPLTDAFALLSPKGCSLKYEDVNHGKVFWSNAGVNDALVHWSLLRKGEGKVCLLTQSGKFLMAQPNASELVISSEYNEYCLFDDIPLFDQWQYFRAQNGHYWGGKGLLNETLEYSAPFM